MPRASLNLLVVEKLPLLFLSLTSSLITSAAQTHHMGFLSHLGSEIRIQNALTSYVAYLSATFWPTDLCVFYPFPREGVEERQAVVDGLLLLSVTLLVLVQLRRRPNLAVGWFWYLGMLFPVIGVIQVGEQARADRYTYLPLIGIFVMLAWGLPDLLGSRWRRAWVPLVSVLLVSCAVATAFQLRHWRDSIALWERAIAVNPNNASAYSNLASDYFRADRPEDAVACARKAAALEPDFIRYHSRLFLILKRLGREEEAKSVKRQLKRMETRPGVFGP